MLEILSFKNYKNERNSESIDSPYTLDDSVFLSKGTIELTAAKKKLYIRIATAVFLLISLFLLLFFLIPRIPTGSFVVSFRFS